MGFIINIIIQVVIAMLIATLFSKPVQSNIKPLGISDFDFPTASQSRPIPVFWGEQEFKAPNLVWAGDFHVEKRTESVRTGFTKKKITVGYLYYMGMQLALSVGGGHASQQVQYVNRMRFGDKVAWTGTALPNQKTKVSARSLYGGDDQGGGISGEFELFSGSHDQVAPDYLKNQIGEYCPSFAGVCYVLWYGASSYEQIEVGTGFDGLPIYETNRNGYVSNSSNLKAMWFTAGRYPNTLGLLGGIERIGNACNPAAMVYELITEDEWGMGWGDASINVTDLTAMAATLHTEGLGLAMTWDNEKSIQDMLDDIMSHIGGYYYEDKLTGQMRFGLFRSDYDTNTLDVLEKPQVLTVNEFSRTSWEGSMNEVSVAYSNPNRFFELDIVTVNDLGNVYVQQRVVPRTNQYHGLVDKAMAVQAAFRDLRSLSLPLVRTVLTCNRSVGLWNVGKVFKWRDPDYEIESLIMRVTKVERGDFTSTDVVIHCIEDVFTRGDAVFATPTDDEWVAPVTTAVPLTTFVDIEMPKGLSSEPNNPLPELYTLVENSSTFNLGYASYYATGADDLVKRTPLNESYSVAGTAQTSLASNDPSYDADATLRVQSLESLPDVGLGANQDSLIYVGGEFIGYDRFTILADGSVQLKGLYRGLLNSVMTDVMSGSTVWLLDGGGFSPEVEYDVPDVLKYKLAPNSLSSDTDPADVTERTHTYYGEKQRPYVLTDLKVNGDYAVRNFQVDTDIVVTWGNNPRDTVGNITASNVVDAALTVDTVYRVSVLTPAGVLATQDIIGLTGATALNTATFTYASLFGAGVQPPPEVWVTVSTLESGTESTYTAAKVITNTPHDNAKSADLTTEPTGEIIFFDGKVYGVK